MKDKIHTLLKGVAKSGQTGLIFSSKKIIGSLGTASIVKTSTNVCVN